LADPLETEQGRFNYYKKKLEEEKAAVTELKDAPPKALDIAMHEANRDAFPPMGLIQFRDVPNGLDEERFVSKRVEDVIKGTVKYVHELESQPAEYLKGWGILRLPEFENSEAGKKLTTKTKTDYTKIAQELSVVEDGDAAEFTNPAMNKMSSGELKDLLDGSLLEFLKEIGVQRSGPGSSESDKMILDHSAKLYEFLDKQNAPAPPKAAEPAPEPAKRMESTETGIKKSEEPKSKNIENTPAPAPAPQAPAQTAPAAKPATPPANIVQQTQTSVTNIVNKSTATKETPTVVQAAQPATVTPAAEPAQGGSDLASNPIFAALGDQLGISEKEMADIFKDGNAEVISGALKSSILEGPEDMVIKTASAPAAVQTQASPAKVATKVTETPKIAEAAPAPPPVVQMAPAAPKEEESKTPQMASQANVEQAPITETTPETPEYSAKSETKPNEEDKNDQSNVNAELLRVMTEVLRTLQGPLMFTDSTHRFS
jgi:hypothetical protein